MTQVVQQRGGDELVASARVLGELSGLQGVRELRDRLAAVLLAAVQAEERFDAVERQRHAQASAFADVEMLPPATAAAAASFD